MITVIVLGFVAILLSIPAVCVVFTLYSDDAVAAAGCVEEGQVF